MKILIIRTYPSIMNIKNYNSQEIGLARAYIRAGHDCDIVYYAGNTKSYTEKIPADNGKEITIHWLRSFSVFNNGFFFGLKKLIKQYDLLQVSEYDQITSWWLYTFGKKPIYVYHGPYDSDISKKHIIKCKVIDFLLLHKKNTAKTTVFTKSELATAGINKRNFGKVITIGVGLDTERFNEKNDSVSDFYCQLKSLKENENVNYLLYIGVLEDRRNIKFLFETFAEVCAKNTQTRLVMIGNGKPDYVKSCFDYADSLNITDKIIYVDALPQNELKQIYEICDVFVFPTKFEIFGMVLLEAMAFGMSVVSSHNGGSSTLIIDDKYGTIVTDFDKTKWSEAICAYLDDDDLRSSIRKEASERILNEFTWDKIAEKILNEFRF